MRRREFIIGSAATALPFAVRAQRPNVARIGVLHVGIGETKFLHELREGLRELGYIEGQDVLFEFRSAQEDLARLPALAAELVALKVNLIVAFYTPCAIAAKQATHEIPIVMLTGDPLGTGLVNTLARPGANVTGVSLMAAESSGKCVELLRDMLAVKQVAVLSHAVDPVYGKSMINAIRDAGISIGVAIRPVMIVHGPDDLDAAFSAIVREQSNAIVVQGTLSNKLVADHAIARRLPAAAVPRSFVDVGGLLSYGADGPSSVRLGAVFVQRILHGKNPADLPVEQPTKFELALNLRTARRIGLEIPDEFVQRVDVVVD